MTKIAHVLGNGPSRKDFVNEPFGDVYGCNLSDFSLDLKATFIMDAVCACVRDARDRYPQTPRSGEDPWWVRAPDTAVLRPSGGGQP